MVPVSSKLWTKKHGFGRKDMPRSRSTQTVNLKMRQRSEFGSKKELNQRKSSYTRASRLILSKGKNTESVEGTTGSLSLHLVRKMCTTLQANGKFGSMQTTTTAGSDEPLKLALAMALLRSKLVNKTSETSHPPSDTSSSEALKWKRKYIRPLNSDEEPVPIKDLRDDERKKYKNEKMMLSLLQQAVKEDIMVLLQHNGTSYSIWKALRLKFRGSEEMVKSKKSLLKKEFDLFRTSTDEEEKTCFWREKNSEFLKKKQAEQKKDSRTCFKCNNVGHIAKDCSQALQSKQGVFRKISEKVFAFESPLDRTKLFKDSIFEIGESSNRFYKKRAKSKNQKWVVKKGSESSSDDSDRSKSEELSSGDETDSTKSVEPQIEKLNLVIKELVKEKDEEKERFNRIIAGLLAEKEKDKVDKDAMLDRNKLELC
uniref:Putative zinc finger, CCHC-type n=1 Tax=Helianthus annuus TaxID=4232 RepID=A0A251VIM2_HELAN